MLVNPNKLVKVYSKLLSKPCMVCKTPTIANPAICSHCIDALIPFKAEFACIKCGQSLPYKGVCGHCQKHPPTFSHLSSVYFYNDLMAFLINEYKHHQNLAIAQFFIDVCRHYFPVHKDCRTAICPVPLHESRLNKRYFNQSAIIAKAISEPLGLIYTPDIVSRHISTPPQQNLSAQKRQQNVINIFTLNALTLPYDKLIIFDDVVTTGATVNSLSKSIKKQHHDIKIEVWSIARA